MNFYLIFEILAGLGVFLVGCKMLSDNMEKIANSRIKALFLKTSDKKLVGVGIGCATTALVQSSGLTTVMVIGLVNAGIMTLGQAATIIIGANIGTTVTAHIAALQSFDFIAIAIGLTGIGAFINLFTKKEKIKTIGNILSGLGLIFVGLTLMKESMEFLKENQTIVDLLASIKNPFLLFMIGIVFTALIQSSSAITSIIISMAAAGILIGGGGNAVLFIILGSNIGSCATSLLSSIGASTNAKRSSMIHLLFNTFGAIIFFIVLVLWEGFMDSTFVKVFNEPATQIAMFHTFFNVICACIFLPFTKYLVKFSQLIIPDKKMETEFTFLDKRLLNTPAIAVESAVRETLLMLDNAVAKLSESLDGFCKLDENYVTSIQKHNIEINEMSKRITDYLVHISPTNSTITEERYISAMHDVISDVVRISELADNVGKYITRSVKEELVFSETVKVEVQEVSELIIKQANNVKNAWKKPTPELYRSIDIIEDEIDARRKDLVKGHIERLNRGECRAESSSVFINLANNLERVGDHLYFIAQSSKEI